MYLNLSSMFVIFSSILAIGALLYLRLIYKNDRKTKQMSKSAYVLLVAFFLQAISFIIYSIQSINQSHYITAFVIMASALSPYVLGRVIRNFEKVNNFIYFQIFIFLLDIILVSF